MKIKYYVTSYGTTIETRKIISETACFVTVETHCWNDRPSTRKISKDNHFDTFEEAKAYLIDRENAKLESRIMQMEAQKKLLAQAEAVSEPKETP